MELVGAVVPWNGTGQAVFSQNGCSTENGYQFVGKWLYARAVTCFRAPSRDQAVDRLHFRRPRHDPKGHFSGAIDRPDVAQIVRLLVRTAAFGASCRVKWVTVRAPIHIREPTLVTALDRRHEASDDKMGC